MLWNFHEILTLTLACLTIGVVSGIPVGVWLYQIPVPDRRPDSPHKDLAAQLDAAAAALRQHDRPRP